MRESSLLDDDRNEVCKLEFYRDGQVGFAGHASSALGTLLGTLPVPSLDEINADPQFEAREIEWALFDSLWSCHVHGLKDQG
ncbi:DUF6881 domain-containing protein [Paraburkholderia sediminicola]|uniref:DUF6881 domain-containing protein n=1 Tax=Paraburkholderia sediminicola TaxID=458836 RepID=UPI0038BAB1F2